jgi:hypothetical protein
MLKKVFE